MRVTSYDLETHRIQDGLLAPPIVCGSTASALVDEDERRTLSREPARLLDRAQAMREIESLLVDQDALISGANIAFDLGCIASFAPELLELIFDALARGRVYDIQIAQALDAIADGLLFKDPRTGGPLLGPDGRQTNRYSLATCLDLTLGRKDAKRHDFWRTRYAILEHVPMPLWPFEARQYPCDDGDNTLDVTLAHLGFDGRKPLRNLGNLPEQVEAAFCMHLGAIWGLRTNEERVNALSARVDAAHERMLARFVQQGFIHGEGPKAGKENTSAIKRAVALAYGASGVCVMCNGTGKVLNAKGNSEIICKAAAGGCDGTGLDVETAPTLPKTETGGISASRDTLLESDNETLIAFGDNETKKIRETYLPYLKLGLRRPINLRPNVLVASGRTSYDGLIQLFPRHGGARDCIEAREGYYFCSVDYSALELCTLAQVCLWVCGYSKMAETINEMKNPGALHTAFAAKMIGVSYEEMQKRIDAKDPVAKNFRQAAKPANFGFPGGMGAAKLVLAQRKGSAGTTKGPDGRVYQGIRFCILIGGEEVCGHTKVTAWGRQEIPPTCKRCIETVHEILKPAYMNAWPEMNEYFAWVSANVDRGGELECFGPVKRIRGGLDFCNGANNGFQALAADGAKHALRKVVREAYTDRNSPLWGTRVIMFVHDELFSEMPIWRAHEAGPRKAQVMVAAMREYVPDVYIAAEPALMQFWYKDAEPVYDASGKLVVWRPKDAGH